MKCPKCNTNNPNDAMFCGECGYKFSHKKNEEKKDKKVSKESSGSLKKVLLIIGIIIVFLIVLIPHKTITRTEQVPYQATEEYSIREPYLDKECEKKEPSYNREQSMEWVNGKVKVICTITNFESVPVKFQYILSTSNELYEEVDSYMNYVTIGAGQTIKKDALLASIISGGHYGCQVEPEYTEECYTITKHKDVIKERKVTKMRTDIIYTNVNWLLRIRMPWLGEWREEGQAKYYYPLKEEESVPYE